MTLQNHGTYKDKLQIYIPPLKKGLVDKTKKLLEKEGSSLSQFLLSKIEEYYRLHEPGNPQQRLDTIAAIGHAYRAESCCVCGKQAEVQAFTEKGLNLLYCRECYEKKGRRVTIGYREVFKKKRERTL